jgi:4-alpha-glucanotransferase
MLLRRSSGILLHPTSLPGPYGIGDFGHEARLFIELLAEAKQGLWQVLPLGPTGFGDSPYASFSSFAGNELLISPDLLAEEGLLERSSLRSAPSFPTKYVDYGALIPWKRRILMRAADEFLEGARSERKAEFESFCEREGSWLPDYALFRAIKDEYDAKAAVEGRWGALWNNYWPAPLALRDEKTIQTERECRAHEIARYEVLQFFFAEQWRSLKKAANAAGLTVIGDLPIFTAEDSSDVWTRRELFLLDEMGRPREVAGVPPDYFSEDGQLWGNPLYNWKAHEEENFAWWAARLRSSLRLYDALRIDHFRGFESFWAVPAGEKTARRGLWRKAPGARLFAQMRRELGTDIPVIAEDLGFITDEVKALRDGLGLPGMRILQFAFDLKESKGVYDPSNPFLPHNYTERCVAYTGTHDNDTLAGWLDKASAQERGYLDRYLGYRSTDRVHALIRELLKSTAAWVIIPLQDLLGLGSESRMNTPSTVGGNWRWRVIDRQLKKSVFASLKEFTILYRRARN